MLKFRISILFTNKNKYLLGNKLLTKHTNNISNFYNIQHFKFYNLTGGEEQDKNNYFYEYCNKLIKIEKENSRIKKIALLTEYFESKQFDYKV